MTPTPPTPSVGAILARAAALIRQRGHAQGHWQDYHQRLCVEGAVVTAVAELTAGQPAELPALTAAPLALIEATLQENIQHWNDNPDRRPEEVIGVLETTARLVDGDQNTRR